MAQKLIFVAFMFLGVGCVEYLIDDRYRDAGVAEDASVPDAGELPDAGDPNDWPACADVGRTVALSPLDLLVVLDVSYSMDYDQKWPAVRSALKSFVNNNEFEGLGVGLQYFPLRAQCRVDQYQTPAVPFRTLPGVAADISASLDSQGLLGGTPTVQVLEGTTAYAKQYLGQNPSHRAVIVLATDGVPDTSCAGITDAGLPNSLANALLVAAGAAQTSPPVKTFVIGVGKELTALNQLAAAGGTAQALLVDTSANAESSFLEALNQIRQNAMGCDFDVPQSSTVLKEKAKVRFVPDDGTPMFYVKKVADLAGCVNGEGWYFDDPLAPKKLMLCNTSCNAITQGKPGQLFVEFACAPT